MSINKNYKIENILEIELMMEKTRYYYLNFFQMQIQTIDLPHEAKQFKATYNRKKEDLEKFVNDRNKLLENQKIYT